jgi:CTP-dependent riboflavin kinase
VPILLGDGIRAAIVVPDVTRYGEELLEVIAPVHLRTRLGLGDADVLSLTIEDNPFLLEG